jgi:multisubunit Na+/H+ antiporter MnhE subunit
MHFDPASFLLGLIAGVIVVIVLAAIAFRRLMLI